LSTQLFYRRWQALAQLISRAAVSAAGGPGSIGCAAMEPEFATKTIQALRGLTDKPINVNFFCHVQAKTATDREEAWRDRLWPYHRELGIDPEFGSK
jgi:nitronate monooxygenase